jgi:hypothetical protein
MQAEREMSYRLPEALESLLGRARNLGDELEKQLRASAGNERVLQLLVGALLPVLETVFSSKAMWWPFSAVAGIHLILLICVLRMAVPLPQFLLEFSALEEKLAELAQQEEVASEFASTFSSALTAASVSIEAIRNLSRQEGVDLKTAFGKVLEPWIIDREAIFWFQEGGALYNIAVYLMSPSGDLELAFRSRDDRIIPQNRSWREGHGHVGVCYSQGRTLFSEDISDASAEELIGTDRPEDKVYYRAVLSIPLWVKGEKRGVFIVTSSVAHQMERDVHIPIAQLAAKLLEHAIEQAEGGSA